MSRSACRIACTDEYLYQNFLSLMEEFLAHSKQESSTIKENELDPLSSLPLSPSSRSTISENDSTSFPNTISPSESEPIVTSSNIQSLPDLNSIQNLSSKSTSCESGPPDSNLDILDLTSSNDQSSLNLNPSSPIVIHDITDETDETSTSTPSIPSIQDPVMKRKRGRPPKKSRVRTTPIEKQSVNQFNMKRSNENENENENTKKKQKQLREIMTCQMTIDFWNQPRSALLDVEVENFPIILTVNYELTNDIGDNNLNMLDTIKMPPESILKQVLPDLLKKRVITLNLNL